MLRFLEVKHGDERTIKRRSGRSRIDLPSHVIKRLRSLSKGQRTRTGLLVAIAHRPELLILDEPSRGLDPIVRRDITLQRWFEARVDRKAIIAIVCWSMDQPGFGDSMAAVALFLTMVPAAMAGIALPTPTAHPCWRRTWRRARCRPRRSPGHDL